MQHFQSIKHCIFETWKQNHWLWVYISHFWKLITWFKSKSDGNISLQKSSLLRPTWNFIGVKIIFVKCDFSEKLKKRRNSYLFYLKQKFGINTNKRIHRKSISFFFSSKFDKFNSKSQNARNFLKFFRKWNKDTFKCPKFKYAIFSKIWLYFGSL